jgi:hypothetical protein
VPDQVHELLRNSPIRNLSHSPVDYCSLTAFVGHMPVSVEDLGTLEMTAGNTLRKLFVHFSSFVLGIPPIISRIGLLENLGLMFKS